MDVLKHLTNCKILSTVSQDEDEAAWLRNRTRGIGGSDIGAICGVSAYASARTVYLQKTGQYDEAANKPDHAASDRMRFGHLLEPVVADEFAVRTGNTVVKSPATLVHKDYPWALANVDRLIIDEQGKPYGILECKTAGEFMKEDWDSGDLPMSYIYQLNWYMWVLDLPFGAFACLVGGNKFFYYEVFRNDELVAEMVAKADYFWNENVLKLVQPDLTSCGADCTLVKVQNSEVVSGSEKVLDSPTANELAQVVKDAKADIKRIQAIHDSAENKLKEMLKDTEIGYTQDFIIKWSPRTQNRVDNDRLKAIYPAVYKDCIKQISFRVFTVK